MNLEQGLLRLRAFVFDLQTIRVDTFQLKNQDLQHLTNNQYWKNNKLQFDQYRKERNKWQIQQINKSKNIVDLTD